MSLLSRYISWFDRFRLFFPKPTRDISSKTNHAEEYVQRWLSRDKAFDHSIPQTIEQAKQKAAREPAVLDDLIEIAAEARDKTLRVVPDTNALATLCR